MRTGSDARAHATLREAKQALRSRVLAVRDTIEPAARERLSAAIAARIRAFPAFTAAHTVLLTLPFRSEWDTRPLARSLLADGRRLVVPRVDRTARMLVLHAVDDLERDVAPGHLGIPEPLPTRDVVAPTAIDVALVPGVAFDAQGRRLGYGGGFYDRLLPLARPDATLCAAAFDEQIVDVVPAAAHDCRIPWIVTPTRILVADVR